MPTKIELHPRAKIWMDAYTASITRQGDHTRAHQDAARARAAWKAEFGKEWSEALKEARISSEAGEGGVIYVG